MSGGEVAVQTSADLLERVVIGGNLAQLSARERMTYYKAVCESVGLNPLTRPFEYITLNNKLTLYAKRDATDQIRKLHGVSIETVTAALVEGIYVVTAVAHDKTGRVDTSTGAVALDLLKGEMRANAMMKAETKAKRRVTLSICGLGLLDETEVDTIPGALVGEPEAPPHDLDATDRHRLVDQIDTDARFIGWTRGEYKARWRHHVGPVKVEDAPIAGVMALADELAELVKVRQKELARQKGASAEAMTPTQEEAPF